MRLYILSAPLLVFGLVISYKDIVSFLLPDEYFLGSLVLPIVAFSGLFVGIMHRYTQVLTFHMRMDVIFMCSASALFVNILFCYMITPLLGLVGAALSTTIAYATWLLLIRLAVQNYIYPLFPWSTLIRVCCALIIAAFPVLGFFRTEFINRFLTLALSAVIGLFAYCFSLYFLGEINKKEIKSIAFLIFKKIGNS